MDEKQDKGEYLYRGIAGRPFERRFNLADFVEVKGASFEDGLLQIELERDGAGGDETASHRGQDREGYWPGR